MGYASAEAVMLTLLVLGFTLIQFRVGRSREEA
jgi:ABC-type sugar transport system permease subunit